LAQFSEERPRHHKWTLVPLRTYAPLRHAQRVHLVEYLERLGFEVYYRKATRKRHRANIYVTMPDGRKPNHDTLGLAQDIDQGAVYTITPTENEHHYAILTEWVDEDALGDPFSFNARPVYRRYRVDELGNLLRLAATYKTAAEAAFSVQDWENVTWGNERTKRYVIDMAYERLIYQPRIISPNGAVCQFLGMSPDGSRPRGWLLDGQKYENSFNLKQALRAIAPPSQWEAE